MIKIKKVKVETLDSVVSNHLDKVQLKVTIKQLKLYGFGLKDTNVKIMKKMTGNVIKSNKCNQCEYATSHAGHLRVHLKIHSGKSQRNAANVTMLLLGQAI